MKLNSRNAKNLSLAAATLLALAMSQPSQAQIAYTVTDIGQVWPVDINNLGQVVGAYPLLPGNPGAFIYSDGKISLITNQASMANSINDAGQVVGWVRTGWRHTNAFLYDNGSLRLLNVPDDFTNAIAINNRGDIIGHSSNGYSSYGDKNFLLDAEGNVHEIYGGLYGLNNLGQVTGTSWNRSSGYFTFIYSDGAMRDIGNPPGSEQSVGFGINDYGDVAGYGYGDGAFVYHDGTMTALGTLPGDDVCEAFDINNHGEVVGFSQDMKRADGRIHAFLFEDGAMHDLNDLIPVDAGWTLQVAQAINDRGQIVGHGYKGNELHGFLLTPLGGGTGVGGSAVPEPAALAFLAGLAVPGIALALRRRRSQ